MRLRYGLGGTLGFGSGHAKLAKALLLRKDYAMSAGVIRSGIGAWWRGYIPQTGIQSMGAGMLRRGMTYGGAAGALGYGLFGRRDNRRRGY